MKAFSKALLAVAAVLAVTPSLTSCSDNNDPEPDPVPTGQGDIKDIVFNGNEIGSGRQEFEVKGKYTLPRGTYILKGWVYVTDGAELTLQPGTVIKGDKDTKAALIVEPGGKLWAQGTAREPIVMTSAQPAGQRRPGDWGGLIVCGRARNNQGKMTIEGGPRTIHGGTDDNDCSGTLSYLRVEFAGYPFATDQEINGITFGSVGRGTKVDHLQVSYSNDDSYEWFGGSVDAKYLVAYKGWDDDFDTDNGFSGRVQFCLGVRDPRLADQSVSNGFESDNCGDAATKEPFTQCVFSNVTLIGPMADATFANTSDYINGGGLNPNNGSRLGQFQSAMQIRRNSHLSCYNSAAVGYPVGLIIENDKGSHTQEAASNGTLALANIYMGGMGIAGSDKNKSFRNSLCADGSTIDDSQASFSATFFGQQSTCHMYDDAASLGLDALWRPTAGSPLLGGASFSDPRLREGFITVSYAGAFSGPSDSWMEGWTCLDPQNQKY